MKFEKTPIPDLFHIQIEPRSDVRGFFARTYCMQEIAASGARFGAIRQTSLSFNPRRGTLRGMHWQAAPAPEGKLVRVTKGRVFDAVIDMRPESKTFRKWFGVELSAEENNSLLIPPFCAHGFLTMAADSVVDYAMDADFDGQAARAVRWNDPAFGIAWPFPPELISDRDRDCPDFEG